MFSLTEINNLKQYLGTITNTVWFVVDIPNPASPSGYDTQKVNLGAIQGFQNFIDLLDTPLSYGAVGEILQVNATQDGLEFVAPSGGGSNLGSADLTSAANERKFILNGAASTNKLVFENSSGDVVMQINGDKSVFIPTGNIAIGDTVTGATNGADKVRIISGTSKHGIYVENNTAKGHGAFIKFEPSASFGTGIGVLSNSVINVAKRGVEIDVTGGNDNVALHIKNGDIKLPSGSKGFTGSAFYTYFVIENGIITNAS